MNLSNRQKKRAYKRAQRAGMEDAKLWDDNCWIFVDEAAPYKYPVVIDAANYRVVDLEAAEAWKNKTAQQILDDVNAALKSLDLPTHGRVGVGEDAMTWSKLKSLSELRADERMEQAGKLFICPVCHSPMKDPPKDYNICGVCMTEFGYDNDTFTIEQLRAAYRGHST